MPAKSDPPPGATALPQRAVLLACSPASLSVEAAGVQVRLAPEPALSGFATGMVAAGSKSQAVRLTLALENVRGTQDATVLQVWLPQRSADEVALGSVGLYGLRRASVPETASGRLLYLDLTPHAALLARALRGVSPGRGLAIALRPRQPLPQGTVITIERVKLYAERPE